MHRKLAGNLDATPNKRVYLSIISDYDLRSAICELIDNALDAWSMRDKETPLDIALDVDTDQQAITLTDNAGGVEQSELRKLISPGETTQTGTEKSIGIFGVGSKRAVVALAAIIKIKSRYKKGQTFQIEYDDDWLQSPDWNLEYHAVTAIPANSTIAELAKLRFRVDPSDIDDLRVHLGTTYAYFLEAEFIRITLNDQEVEPRTFTNWSFVPDFPPTSYEKKLIEPKSQQEVRFRLTTGLHTEPGSIAGEYGVYFYCNDRLICASLQTPEVGFLRGFAGQSHPKKSLARVIVELEGPSSLMPWNSSKNGINFNHPIFQAIKDDIFESIKNATQWSDRLYPEANSKVRPHSSGSVIRRALDTEERIRPSRLPKAPRKYAPKMEKQIASLNQILSLEKPWTRGIWEAIAAETIISRQNFNHKNRISLIILDSTLEIALKEYLVNEAPEDYSPGRLNKITQNRHATVEEAKKHLNITADIWKILNNLYNLRCDLIHRKASADIPDNDMQNYRSAVSQVISKALGVQIPRQYYGEPILA